MLLIIDNYDSFVYNLYHGIASLGMQVEVVRNDAITLDTIGSLPNLKGIILSPGPGKPEEAGITLDLVKAFYQTIPILGVCLGHQAIAQALGGTIIRGHAPVHGKVSRILHTHQGLFNEIPQAFQATRYHSLVIDPASLPTTLTVTAKTEDGYIMGIQHEIFNIHGVQFHPESIATEYGIRLLGNFLSMILSTDDLR